jgi:hypothetical protein
MRKTISKILRARLAQGPRKTRPAPHKTPESVILTTPLGAPPKFTIIQMCMKHHADCNIFRGERSCNNESVDRQSQT